MTIKQAVKILERHNKWRRGNGKVHKHSPKDIGKAIDIVVGVLSKLSKDGRFDRYQF